MTQWRGVRWDPATLAWELRCEMCSRGKRSAWWPLDHEFWDPQKGLTRCRACWNAYQREYTSGRRHAIVVQPAATIAQKQAVRRAYCREWAARKRAEDRAAEGRARYERRRVA